MTLNGWIQIILFFGIVVALVKPLGWYMTRVFSGERTFLSPVLRPVEASLYWAGGVDEKREQDWLTYTVAMLLFNVAGFLALYFLLRVQGALPLNPQGMSAVPEALSFNTAVSFVTKPFSMNELLARIRAAVRHQLQSQGERPIFQVGDLSVDLVRRIVKMRGQDVKLSPKEYDLLRLFVQHAGKVLTHNYLLDQLWGPSADAQYVRVYVRQLRNKIEPQPDRPEYIHTETGVGYRLRLPD